MRYFIFMFFCIFLSAKGDAQCISGDCKNGYGKMNLGYAVYEGSFKNGEPEGMGTMDYGGGDKYTGTWQKGKEDGAGTLYKKGVATKVFYREGVLQVTPTKEVAIGGNGDWKEKVLGCITGDCREGEGEIVFPSGNRYKGLFRNGVANGSGEWSFASGDVLKAVFEENKPLHGTYWHNDVKTLFTGTFNPDGTAKDGTYTARSMDAVVVVKDGHVTAEYHPKRDSLNAIAAKHAREFGRCAYCEGKGQYLNTTWSSMKSTRTEGTGWTPTGGYTSNVTYKTTGGFSQNMITCPKCKGTGEIKR